MAATDMDVPTFKHRRGYPTIVASRAQVGIFRACARF